MSFLNLFNFGASSTQTRENTSTRTRERLSQAEAELEKLNMGTSSRTREKLALAEAQLEKLNMATSSKTREKLALVEKRIKEENEKRTSTKTMLNFQKKQEILRKMIKEKSNLDLVFLVDCTGSMSSFINGTKNQIEAIVNSIKETFENKVNLAFVGYRDHCDTNRIESLSFTEDVFEFKNFVGKITADGGGDAPEDVFGGLEAAINLPWSSTNKVMFHVCDAPQHGSRFHDLGGDNYISGDPRGLQIEDLLNNIKQMKIKYFFGKINNSTDKMIAEFKNVGGNDIVQYTDMNSPDLTSLLVVDSVTKTINTNIGLTMHTFKMIGLKKELASISEASEERKTLKDFSISDVGPEEAKMEDIPKAQWLECYIPHLTNISEIKNQIGAINHKWSTARLLKTKDPFSQGEQRISYHGQRIYDGKRNEKVVFKEFKHIGKGRDRREDYIEIMETQAVAAYLANEFNKVAPSGSKKIEFLHVSVVQISEKDGTPKYYNIEVLLNDYKENFKKWNNNCGYVSDKDYSASLDAFSHWTYHVTNEYLLVVDIQGVDRTKEYVLTDPSIHCKEPRFGLTNLGRVGIEEFFKTHSCGNVCEAMRIPKNSYMRMSTPKRLSKMSTKVAWR